jgi:hypothetical protein
MKEIGPATEHEMVLRFLQGEIDSPRFGIDSQDHGPRIEAILKHYQVDRAQLIDNGDATNSFENQIRMVILRTTRGYANHFLFQGFPTDIQWRRIQLDSDELHRLKYANFPSWVELSGGSRRAVDGAMNLDAIQTDEDIAGNVQAVVELIKGDHTFPDLIAVQTDTRDLVLIEGHTRATAYAVSLPASPTLLIVGSSSKISQWRWI